MRPRKADQQPSTPAIIFDIDGGAYTIAHLHKIKLNHRRAGDAAGINFIAPTCFLMLAVILRLLILSSRSVQVRRCLGATRCPSDSTGPKGDTSGKFGDVNGKKSIKKKIKISGVKKKII